MGAIFQVRGVDCLLSTVSRDALCEYRLMEVSAIFSPFDHIDVYITTLLVPSPPD